MIAFHPEAVAEIALARDWYEAKRPGLGADLVDKDGEDVLIVALAHARRQPGYWRRRVAAKR